MMTEAEIIGAVIAGITLIVAAITLVFGIRQWRIQRKQEAPWLDTKGIINFKDFIFEVSLCNTGNASARLDSIELYFNNLRVKASDLISVVNKEFPQKKTIEVGTFAKGQVIPPESEQVLFKITFKGTKPSKEDIEKFMFDGGRVIIHYTSMDGRKFIYQSKKPPVPDTFKA